MHIIRAVKKDLQEILALQYQAYQSEAELCNNQDIPPLTQTLKEVEDEFNKGVILKAVDENGTIIGSVRACSKNGTLYIGKLIVRPDLQGQGIGTRILREIEQICPHKRYELFTSTKSARNIKLYEREGYVKYIEKDIGNNLIFVYLCKYISTQ